LIENAPWFATGRFLLLLHLQHAGLKQRLIYCKKEMN
jgi:hypothetical protein